MEKNDIIGSFNKLYTIVECSWGIPIKEEEVNCSCGTHGIMSNACSILPVKSEENNCLRSLGVDERIILKWILRKLDVNVRTRFIWLWVRTSLGVL
jgi:hypothetical protein